MSLIDHLAFLIFGQPHYDTLLIDHVGPTDPSGDGELVNCALSAGSEQTPISGTYNEASQHLSFNDAPPGFPANFVGVTDFDGQVLTKPDGSLAAIAGTWTELTIKIVGKQPPRLKRLNGTWVGKDPYQWPI